MSVFEYVALDSRGRERKGFVDAPGVTAARQALRDGGIYPVEIRQAKEKKSSALSSALEITFLQKISAKEVSIFTVNSPRFWVPGFRWCLPYGFAGTNKESAAAENPGPDPR